jgi:glycosyltransferase involved in cell wall biosynthesis
MVAPMRVAWFSPLPPDASGIAAYSAEVVPLLTSRFGALDLYSATAAARRGATPRAMDPVDFTWRHRRQPYDVVVYQLGNSKAHDFMWSFLFRYPGLLVLHDAQVHQARALWLLSRLEPRLADYLAEVRASHPGASPDLGYLFAAGLGGELFRLWPLVSLVIRASRLTAVHNAHLATALASAHPDAAVTTLEMGTADPLAHRPSLASDAAAIRQRYRIPPDAVVIGAYGGITPEKRIPQLLTAVAASGDAAALQVLLVGQRAAHYDVDADIARLGLAGRVHVAGYVADEALPAHLAVADVCWCLRWPSSGETSASWLRCLAAGRPTLITALAQLQDVPALAAADLHTIDPAAESPAIGVAIDPLDEPREVPLALQALAARPDLRRGMGARARRHWESRHTLPRMADAYERLILEAAARRAPSLPLPPHLLDDGSTTTRRILSEMGVGELPW